MDIKEALKELTRYADDFANIGDAKEALKNNREGFLHARTKVMQYYRYIISNTEIASDEWFKAIDIVDEISETNPSLEEWVMGIIDPKSMETPKVEAKKAQSDDSIDPSSLANKIESFVTEIQGMQFWDEDKVDDIAWQLRQSLEELQKNVSAFEPGLYSSLLRDGNAALDKIDRFQKMINSDSFAEIRKMG